MNLKLTKKIVGYMIVALLLFFIGYTIPNYFSNKGTIKKEAFNHDLEGYEGGVYLRFVYIGSESCLWCGEETNSMVKKLKDYYKELADKSNLKFISTGIANDYSSIKGINFLSKSGVYDEIISGGNYYNIGSQRYIWNDFPSNASTPQILITLSEFMVESAGTGEIFNIQLNEKLLVRIEGYYEIIEHFDLVDSSSHDKMSTVLGL